MKWLKMGAVVLGAIAVTALGIDASDTLRGSRSTLLGQVIDTQVQKVCPVGMIEVPVAQTFTCIDTYEASAGDACETESPSSARESQDNINKAACMAVSEEGATPWRYITREQAMTACMRAGKRLPTASEWYLASVGTPDEASLCNVSSNGHRTAGENEQCVSALGAYDMIGNVWEWVSDDVIEGVYQGRALPETGYVTQVDTNGVAVLSNNTASDLFYEDYFWSSQAGAFGMIRGGFYGSREDAGVYAIHADTPPTTAGTAIGFRCVK